MKRTTILAVLATLVVAAAGQDARAQRNAEAAMYMPPNPQPAPAVPAGASAVHCSFTIDPMAAAPFGVSELKGTSTPVEFIVSSQNTPYTVFRMDEDCNVLSSWTTASLASSNLGLAYDTNTGTTYWMMQNTPSPRQVIEYQMGTGTPTGRNYLVDNFGVPGPLCTNDNSPNPTDMYYEDIALDIIYEIDPTNQTSGCTFPNPDDMGNGAFGNGIDDAVDPSCGADLTVSSGTIGEGQVVRAGQFDCGTTPCPDTWDILRLGGPSGITFVQSFSEFTATGGETRLFLADGNNNTMYCLRQAQTIADCQGVDGERLFTVNLSDGGSDFTLPIFESGQMVLRALLPASGEGRGKYTVNFNAGLPDDSTIVSLPGQLGVACFNLADTIPPTQMVHFQNFGRTRRLGITNYFGTPVPDPPRAPTEVWRNATGDPANMPAGSCWTVQGVTLNPNSSSPKGASVSNAIALLVE